MGDELVDFLEGSRIEQQIDALARRQLSGLVLPLQPVFAAAEFRSPFEIIEIGEGLRPDAPRCTLGRGGPRPRSARVARSLPIALRALASSGRPAVRSAAIYFFAPAPYALSQSDRNFFSPMSVSG